MNCFQKDFTQFSVTMYVKYKLFKSLLFNCFFGDILLGFDVSTNVS
jgi:hypothetical protein